MKSKLLFPIIFFFIFFATSCKKEAVAPAIVGEWLTTAVYSDPVTGGEGWVTNFRFAERITFNSNSEFFSFTDVPGGSGTYNYSRSSNELQLNFDADRYGSPIVSSLLKVESLTNDKLITTYTYANGSIRKSEYIRVNR